MPIKLPTSRAAAERGEEGKKDKQKIVVPSRGTAGRADERAGEDGKRRNMSSHSGELREGAGKEEERENREQ